MAFNHNPLASLTNSLALRDGSRAAALDSSLLGKKDNQNARNESALPLTTSKFANQNQSSFRSNAPKKKHDVPPTSAAPAPSIVELRKFMTRSTSQQYLHDRPKRVVTGSISSTTLNTFCKEGVPLEEPLSRDSYESSSTDSVTVASGSEHPSRHSSENVLSMGLDEVARLKNELAAAKTQIARMDEELCQSRITKHTIDQALEPLNESVLVRRSELNNQAMEDLQASFNTLSRPSSAKEDLWNQEGHQMDEDDIRVGKLGNKASAIWASGSVRGTYRPTPFAQNEQPYNLTPSASWNAVATRAWHQPQLTSGPAHQPFAPSANLQYNAATMAKEENPFKLGLQPQVALEPDQYHADHSLRRNLGLPNRPITANGPSHRSPTVWGNDYTSFAHPLAASSRTSSPMTQTSFQHLQMPNLHTSQVPRPIGTRLSPTAAEFNAEPAGHSPWNSQLTSDNASTYVASVEPINYRKLLDRNMSCNWKYIVDKIVCSNDQQASIFLQQKLKASTPEHKYEIIDAIIAQAYPLMVNRFGNFLIQRCFEHGTPEQIVAIANAIRGNTLTLSMDAFGCHVVQKAFDSVPEEHKAIMVHELLRRIPETVIHRYACHVWQKLFELRWSDSPPQIMKYVNEALRGMWHEVALGETGSLVVQNIFENCLEEDKRPCINEVLASIDVVAHGQYGNWCIQHICEHGAPADRSRAIEHVLRFSTEYSMDQFASKIIEKCLKVCGPDFLGRYLDRVCEGRIDRPRMPLIDIAGDQFGNYLIQHILVNAGQQHRELVASHVRKHMVSLRGSKYGSRVAMLCCNPASATRPGPPAGMQANRYLGNANPTGRPAFNSTYR